MSARVSVAALLALCLLLASATAAAARFTQGNVVVYQVGDGFVPLSTVSSVVRLVERRPNGTLVQIIPLPTDTMGSNARCVASGVTTSEGMLTRSEDQRFLVGTCYDANVGTSAISGTSSFSTPRVIFRADADAQVDTTTVLSEAFSGGSPRGATSTDGIDLWATGAASSTTNQGVRHTTFGATTNIRVSPGNLSLRNVGIFGGQLYVSTGSSNFSIAAVGTGTPTAPDQTIVNLPGLPTTGSPFGFVLLDLENTVSGSDTLYVADDLANAIQKYSLVSGSWTANGSVTATGVRGLAATTAGTDVILFATSSTTLFTLSDTSGYDGELTGTVMSIATADVNTAFRGVAMAPVVYAVFADGFEQ